MTIIEDAVKRLEQARAARRKDEAGVKPVGTLVEKHSGDEATAAANGHPQALPDGASDSTTDGQSMAFQLEREADRSADTAGAEVGADAEAARTAFGSGKIVAVDRDALRAAGLLPPEDEEHRLIDEFRNIKRPIVAHALGRRATKIEEGRLVMVASALTGEGKTFTCINLALSMARERDVSVVLVDADVAKPHISRLFGVAEEPGLLDILDDPDKYDYRDLVLDTDVPGLSLLPAGRSRSHATELLSSERMEALLTAYRKDNIQRLVLFDSPPLLQTPEARVLAGLVGQIALVVRADSTPQHVVLDAIASLDEGKAVNLILNQTRHGSGSGYYAGYQGYGYGYGYGGRSQSDAEESSA